MKYSYVGPISRGLKLKTLTSSVGTTIHLLEFYTNKMCFNKKLLQIKSPPPVVNSAPSSSGGSIDWSALFGFSNPFSNFTRKNNQTQEKNKIIESKQIVSNVNQNTFSAKQQLKSSNKQIEIVAPPTGKKPTDNIGLKRKVAQLNDKVGPENPNLLSQPLKKPNNQNTSLVKPVSDISTQQIPVVEKTNLIGNKTEKGINKENITTNNSLSNLKKYMLNLSTHTKSSTSNLSQIENTVSHHLSNMLTLKNSDKIIEIEKNTPAKSYDPATKPTSEDKSNPESEMINQTNPEEAERNKSFEGDLFANKNNDKQAERSTCK